MLTFSGKFTLRSAWDYIRKKNSILQNIKDLWMIGIPFKVSFFLVEFAKEESSHWEGAHEKWNV